MNTLLIEKYFPIVLVSMACIGTVFLTYELYVHTEYFSECIKSHRSQGGSSMTSHNICDEYTQVKNPYYRSTFP